LIAEVPFEAEPAVPWIADFVTQENLRQMFDDSPRADEAVRSVFRSTNRDVVRDNPFTDDASVATFIAERGLRVERTIWLADVVADGKFYSPVRSWHEAMFRLVGQRKIWEKPDKVSVEGVLACEDPASDDFSTRGFQHGDGSHHNAATRVPGHCRPGTQATSFDKKSTLRPLPIGFYFG
jgi:hypothetical protein